MVNKIEHIIERLLESQHLKTRENVFVICLDGFSKRFYNRYKRKVREHKGLDINSICLTNGENTVEGPLVLKILLICILELSNKRGRLLIWPLYFQKGHQ